MDMVCEERPSDSPFVERIWRSQSGQADTFISVAASQWGMVVTKHGGKTVITVRGPETRASSAIGHADAEFFGIHFKAGAFIPNLPVITVSDRRDLNLPQATSSRFWFSGSSWQFPNYENADTFVERMVHAGLLVRNPVVEAALHGQHVDMSLRTLQRHFLRATGLTQSAALQINRARYATSLLKHGVSILDTVNQAGYFDQPHLTRSLRRYVGLTPAQIINKNRPERLSFLYKTEPPHQIMMRMSVPEDEERGREKNNRIGIPNPGWSDGSAREVVLPIPERRNG